MKLYNLGGWLLVGLAFLGLNTLRYEPVPAVDLPAVYAQIDTTTYGDARIVYKLSTDTARNTNGDLRRLPDLSAAPTGARWRVIWKQPNYDSVMLVTGDTFALSPLDSATATAVATAWGVTDPHTVTLAWHVPPGAAPDPLENVAVVASHDTLRTSWTSVSDSVRIFSGLNSGPGQEDTFYVAGNATPHDRVVSVEGSFYSCGNAYTTQAEGDYAANRCGSATIDTVEPGGSEDFPNEPAGFTEFAYIDFTNNFTAQTGVADSLGHSGNLAIVTNDGTAPSGDSSVVRQRFPDGEVDGSSNGRRFDLWGPTIDAGGGSNQYDEIYLSFWFKIEGSDYQNQSVGTKVLYVSYGRSTQHNDGFLMLEGSGSQSLMTSMRLKFYAYEPSTGTQVSHAPNQGSQNVVVGSWQQIELYMKIDDAGSQNGVLKMWVDGTLTHHYTDMDYTDAEGNRAFYHLQFTPVYGGNAGDVRTRDDFWRTDEVYISGVSS